MLLGLPHADDNGSRPALAACQYGARRSLPAARPTALVLDRGLRPLRDLPGWLCEPAVELGSHHASGSGRRLAHRRSGCLASPAGTGGGVTTAYCVLPALRLDTLW